MEDHSMIINGEDNDSTSSIPSLVNSTISDGLSSSSTSSEGMADDDDDDDDESSSSNLCSSSSLYDLSDLMAHLPIKRGLSKFYGGKSQSFTSLSRVTSIEDLPKKQTHYTRKMKASKSYGGGLDKFKSYTLPKPTIVKKASRISLLSSSSDNNCRPPLIPL